MVWEKVFHLACSQKRIKSPANLHCRGFIFILVLSITLLAYFTQSRVFELIWLGGFVAFALHLLLHIGQSILLRKYIPALITSILCFPVSAYLITDIVHLWQVSTSEFFLFSLVGSGIVFINLPFALWLGKKYSAWLAHKNE